MNKDKQVNVEKQRVHNIALAFLKRILPVHVKKLVLNFYIVVLEKLGKDIDFLYNKEFQSPYLNITWPHQFCSIVMEEFRPLSVIDFGCSFGNILAPYEERGVEILGLEGSKVAKEYLKIKRENFLLFDLRHPYRGTKKYDLCLCLEVAEHINEKYSDILVESIVLSGRTIIFSAATPGQGGTGHVNEKPHMWWINKFERYAFKLDDQLTKLLRIKMGKTDIPFYYTKNILVFRNQ